MSGAKGAEGSLFVGVVLGPARKSCRNWALSPFKGTVRGATVDIRPLILGPSPDLAKTLNGTLVTFYVDGCVIAAGPAFLFGPTYPGFCGDHEISAPVVRTDGINVPIQRGSKMEFEASLMSEAKEDKEPLTGPFEVWGTLNVELEEEKA